MTSRGQRDQSCSFQARTQRSAADIAAIAAEVRRLAPWYYLFDFGGVRTDLAPPCDCEGFRSVRLPEIWPGFWAGKHVLDVACNEGGYAFWALEHGADRVVAFDCRPINIEKARFAARMLAHERITFHVATTDEWLTGHPESYDVVLLCGILYHLQEPESAIAAFCSRARQWIYVTSLIDRIGGSGWIDYDEHENVAASAGALPSRVPGGSLTLLREFERHGFRLAYLEEAPRGLPRGAQGGCNLVLRRCTGMPQQQRPLADPVIDVSLIIAGGELLVSLYSTADRDLEATGELALLAPDGRRESLGVEVLRFERRASAASAHPSRSIVRRLPWNSRMPGPWTRLTARVTDRASGRVLGASAVELPPARRQASEHRDPSGVDGP